MFLNQLLQSIKELVIIGFSCAGYESHALETCPKDRKWKNTDILFFKELFYELFVCFYLLEMTKIDLDR